VAPAEVLLLLLEAVLIETRGHLTSRGVLGEAANTAASCNQTPCRCVALHTYLLIKEEGGDCCIKATATLAA
jgi:hypothetical protein